MDLRIACAALALVVTVPSAGAQTPASPPDPSAVTIPDLSGGRDPAVVSNGWKYFYFWRADTSYAEAYADIADCYRFMPAPNATASVPRFVPWEEAGSVATVQPSVIQPYGIVGAVIGEIIAGPLVRRAHQSRLRRCMEPRGYQRYPLQERRWELLTDNFSPASIAMQAKAASGPRPDGDPLPEDR